MKISQTLIALAIPLTLASGCALEVDSSSDSLTVDQFADFGINRCGGAIENIFEDEWPIDTIVAGDMVMTQQDLIEYVHANPGDRAALIAEVAHVQLDMAVGLVIPDPVLEEFVNADDVLMTADLDDVPPPVISEDFGDLLGYSSEVAKDCFVFDNVSAEATPITIDVRDNLFENVRVDRRKGQEFAPIDQGDLNR